MVKVIADCGPGDTPHQVESASVGRRARKAQAVRRGLFESGLTAFGRQPIGLVSVLDITEGADVAKGVFYLHFGSKDEFLLALWEEVQNRVLGHFRVIGAIGSGCVRPEDLMQAYVGLADACPREARFWLRMMSYAADEIGPPGRLEEVRAAWTRRVASLLAEQGAMPRSDHAAAIDALGWACVSLAIAEGAEAPTTAMLRQMAAAAARAL